MRTPILLSVAVLCLACSPSMAALTAYMTITGRDQGQILGSVTQLHREGQIAVYGFTHAYSTLPDPTSCMALGEQDHSPLTVVKEFDRATNGLMRAWMNREPLEVTIYFVRPTGAGPEEQYFTIILQNALISGIHQEMFNNRNLDMMQYPVMERIGFTYERITQSWIPNRDEVVDKWFAHCSRADVLADLNFDGVVNILDFAIMADQWLMQGY